MFELPVFEQKVAMTAKELREGREIIYAACCRSQQCQALGQALGQASTVIASMLSGAVQLVLLSQLMFLFQPSWW